LNRIEAKKLFETTVPAQFIADTAEPERDEVRRMLTDSTTFFHCMAGVRVGDRYVIQGAAIDPEQSTGPNCIFLISMLVQRVAAVFDRFGKEGEIGLTLPGAQCTDPGPVVGGFGGVKVRMWIEPIPD
jgi:hypothetical protein